MLLCCRSVPLEQLLDFGVPLRQAMASTVQPGAASTVLATVWASVLVRAALPAQQVLAQGLWEHHSQTCARLVQSLLEDAQQVGRIAEM